MPGSEIEIIYNFVGPEMLAKMKKKNVKEKQNGTEYDIILQESFMLNFCSSKKWFSP